MSTRKGSKLNQLIAEWPRGAVYTQRFLSARGYDPYLMRRYRQSGWFQAIGSGAYILNGDMLSWQGALFALQQQLKLPVHVGGRSALALQGYSHYARFQNDSMFLFAPQKITLPKWFHSPSASAKMVLRTSNLLPFDIAESFTESAFREISFRMSTPERAVLEMLYDVPQLQGFDEADKIIEGLMTLRPQLMQLLLEHCNSVKVKRLLLLMAENHQLPWFEELTPEKINLGTGKRMLIQDGQLDAKYKITVPRGYGSNA